MHLARRRSLQVPLPYWTLGSETGFLPTYFCRFFISFLSQKKMQMHINACQHPKFDVYIRLLSTEVSSRSTSAYLRPKTGCPRWGLQQAWRWGPLNNPMASAMALVTALASNHRKWSPPWPQSLAGLHWPAENTVGLLKLLSCQPESNNVHAIPCRSTPTSSPAVGSNLPQNLRQKNESQLAFRVVTSHRMGCWNFAVDMFPNQ